ncbi:MAG: hypothetical protein MZV70_10970 [Desulfobacterales bacterium]|nr:hypothetical protein [Desulfobacterales bacterium]
MAKIERSSGLRKRRDGQSKKAAVKAARTARARTDADHRRHGHLRHRRGRQGDLRRHPGGRGRSSTWTRTS